MAAPNSSSVPAWKSYSVYSYNYKAVNWTFFFWLTQGAAPPMSSCSMKWNASSLAFPRERKKSLFFVILGAWVSYNINAFQLLKGRYTPEITAKRMNDVGSLSWKTSEMFISRSILICVHLKNHCLLTQNLPISMLSSVMNLIILLDHSSQVINSISSKVVCSQSCTSKRICSS